MHISVSDNEMQVPLAHTAEARKIRGSEVGKHNDINAINVPKTLTVRIKYRVSSIKDQRSNDNNVLNATSKHQANTKSQ